VGRQGLAEFSCQLAQFRAGWWYLIGPAVVAFYHGVALLVMQATGSPQAQAPSLTMSTVLVVLVLGGQWEEPGWTGYALPRVRQLFAGRAHPPPAAAITLGLFRALWHLPLVLSGAVHWFDMVFLAMAMQLIIVWIYDRSGGSVPVVAGSQFASNIAGAMMGQVNAGKHHAAYFATFIAVACIIAILVSIPRRSGNRNRKLLLSSLSSSSFILTTLDPTCLRKP
jgi:hypothetical protein